jgi:subtilase family serine protease
MIVSAGDLGYGVSWPASLNTVISVGGTSLTLNGSGGYGSETVWGHSGGGTGSGCSSAAVSPGLTPVKAKLFQKSAAGWAATKCGTFRGDNDVAANADPNTGSAVYVGSLGAFVQVGGTSLSAPLIAGVYALKGNATTTAYPASLLYARLGTAAFHDVTTGSDDQHNWPNACPAASTQCQAATGYDLPTGVGTPKGLNGF